MNIIPHPKSAEHLIISGNGHQIILDELGVTHLTMAASNRGNAPIVYDFAKPAHDQPNRYTKEFSDKAGSPIKKYPGVTELQGAWGDINDDAIILSQQWDEKTEEVPTQFCCISPTLTTLLIWTTQELKGKDFDTSKLRLTPKNPIQCTVDDMRQLDCMLTKMYDQNIIEKLTSTQYHEYTWLREGRWLQEQLSKGNPDSARNKGFAARLSQIDREFGNITFIRPWEPDQDLGTTQDM